MVAPEKHRPDLFLDAEDETLDAKDPRRARALRAWFAAPERRWLLTRRRDLKRDFGAAYAGPPPVEVAEGGGYVVVTNLPLPPPGR